MQTKKQAQVGNSRVRLEMTNKRAKHVKMVRMLKKSKNVKDC